MNINKNKTQLLRGLIWTSCISLAGCATTPDTLYGWENYQPQVYEYLKNTQQNPEAQIITLEADIQKIRAKGKTPPPGYYAHLGLLYAQIGKNDQAVQAFETEKKLFPESSTYMNLSLKNLKSKS